MTKPEVIDGGQSLLQEAGGIDFVALMDGYGVIHHLTSRALTIEKAEADMFALVGNLIGVGWTVHNDARELGYGNKVSRNTEDPNAEVRTPLDDNGEPIVEDKGKHKPGDVGFWHVTNMSLGKLKEGHVKVVMEGLAGDKKAEFPWVSVNMTLGMIKHILEIIIPEAKEDEYYNQPHDDVVNWKVSYRYGNKMNDKGYYWKNVESIELWSE
jgi:hypothetical protein